MMIECEVSNMDDSHYVCMYVCSTLFGFLGPEPSSSTYLSGCAFDFSLPLAWWSSFVLVWRVYE